MTQADLIREARDRAGISQHQLSALTGLNQSFISRLEAGIKTATVPETVAKLAEALDLTTDWLYLAAGLAPPDIVAMMQHRPGRLAVVRDVLEQA